ncbi:D-alanyl-D-alanine carboxypeptidase [Streptomyces sp. NPDC052012]|uniref:D-alanyl-D-alanine carboxypeptidase n=1 Tax=Streptomyces sp. NPDC052012 TaxID=3155051 RepID=UPI00344B1E4C
MAGESPDRSKQRESSAGTTSGSAGPVPEARSSAEPRDPRLAVARDASPSSRGKADTATQVLSVRGAADAEAKNAGDAPEEPEQPGDTPPPAGQDEAAAESDGRLRDAVAAWVRSADPTEEASEASRDATTTEADAEADGTAAAGTEEPETSPAATEADSADADVNADSDAPESTDTDADDAPNAGTDSDTDTDDAPEAGTDSDTDADERRGRAGDAEPDAAGADGTDAENAPETDATDGLADAENPSGPDATGEGGDERPGGHADASTGAGGVKAGDREPATDGGQGARSGTASDDSDTGDDAEASEAPEVADDSSGSEDAGEPDTGDGASDAPKGGGADGDDAPQAGPAADDKGEDRAAASHTPGGGDHDDAPQGGDGAPQEGPGAGGEGEGPVREAAGGKGAGGERKQQVDQPTAVFKTVRSGPALDQPTTMLRVGDTGERDKGESESERTSKFVALKALDDPGIRKPVREETREPAADATTALPQIGPERTAQQPLPPKPPLDLLAELTNTPPPPETPLRTAVRRVKIWTPLVLLLAIVFAVVQNMRPLPEPTLDLTAEDSYTFEGGKPNIPWPADGQAALDVQGIGTFGSSGEQKPVPIASVAKVMTAYLILRDHPLKSGAEGPMIGIDKTAEEQSDAGQESTVKVTAGDKISQREAIESILIASANNVARLLARWDAGSEKAFVEKMNDAAKDLGMTNTTYTDPSGLNNTTVSTAVDQVKLAKAAMKQPAFREVAAMMEYIDYKGVKHGNWNRLVGHNDVVGIKTGTTTSALGNLVFAAKKDVDGETQRIVGAVLRQPEGGVDNTILSGALAAGDQLIRAAQDTLESATILKKGTVVGYADDGLGGRTPVVVTEDVKAVGWAGLSVKLTFAADEVPHQAKAGTKVGTLTVGDGTSSAVKVPVALHEDMVEPGFTDKLTRIA